MRRWRMAGIAVMLSAWACSHPRAHAPSAPPAASIPVSEAPPLVTFASAVRPVLARTCTPCHEPGGKMYAPMPFDQPDVVRTHEAGILRRLKGADREAVERWLASEKTETR